MKATAKRQSEIELLRIFAAMGVLLLHYCKSGLGNGLSFVQDGSVNEAVLLTLESLYICAVDVFMIISGYFMCRKFKTDLRKPIELLLQLTLIELAFYIVRVFTGSSELSGRELFIAIFPKDYFVIFYVITFIFAPYINLFISKLSLKNFRLLLLIVFLLFSVHPGLTWLLEYFTGIDVNDASTVTFRGSMGGYTIVNFIMCYLLGAGISLGAIKRRSRLCCTAVLLLCTAVMAYTRCWDYCHPFVIIEAVAVFMLFSSFSFSCNVVNKLARAAFTVYLIHEPLIVRVGVTDFVAKSTAIMLCHILATQVFIYLVGFLVYIIWESLAGRLLGLFWKKVKAPTIDLESL